MVYGRISPKSQIEAKISNRVCCGKAKGNKTDFVDIFHVVLLILFSIALRRSQVYYHIFILHIYFPRCFGVVKIEKVESGEN